MPRKIAPIGPLAIGLRWVQGNDGQTDTGRLAIALAVLFAVLLTVGLGIVIATG